uniref:Uncharacterized protein n=1 Tax=Anguilla anguilla TaxID=7936 RepID=A0A0E9UYN6_ANGAN
MFSTSSHVLRVTMNITW